MKILLTGGSGQLGQDCQRTLATRHTVVSADKKRLDITNSDQVGACLNQERPDAIINCAAYTAVDACETNHARCLAINGEGPAILAHHCNGIGAKLVHISTDYVFDGTKPLPQAYTEQDPPNPLSQYGRSKLVGEQGALQAQDALILRPAWLYGISGGNFLKTMLRLVIADPTRVLKVVADQHGSMTWTHRLAEQIACLLENDGCHGIYHSTAEGSGSWYEVASHFLAGMGVDHTLIPCTTAEYPTPAHRPANSILENQRLKEAGLNRMVDWRADLDLFIEQHHQELLDEARMGNG